MRPRRRRLSARTMLDAEISDPAPFISALSLDASALRCDRSRIHTIWGTSKTFGSSECRMDNGEANFRPTAAYNTQLSLLSALSATSLLSSPSLPLLVALSSARLAESYILVTTFFIRHHIDYIPVNAGLNIFARLAPSAKTWEDESAIIAKLKAKGVVVQGGGSYHGTFKEKGWSMEPVVDIKAIGAQRTAYGQETYIESLPLLKAGAVHPGRR
ncbi:predicted protein [Histoplasma mississippiense (nom. inval.)]|uniref:predicted protein n=1 Tax=Ajellomyces capsulatus (strain NAm1 / WU24) TaxID=2059318 RepID=UPI000157B666|nr:predicted protein [Histoplasma mississippiense (nom. inval.)]EDN02660.1 predicted protein [Histoplasma mississippiense (nom. inval.)]